MLRDDSVVPGLLVVRMGVNTMSDERLTESAEQCHENWGLLGFFRIRSPRRRLPPPRPPATGVT